MSQRVRVQVLETTDSHEVWVSVGAVRLTVPREAIEDCNGQKVIAIEDSAPGKNEKFKIVSFQGHLIQVPKNHVLNGGN